MYPNLFGIPDSSYVIMIGLGIIACFVLIAVYLKTRGFDRNKIIDVLLCACSAIAAGVIGAILTQNFYDLIAHPETYKWTWGMTFYGGLIFGVVEFLLVYLLVIQKRGGIDIKYILIIAPAAITLAHAFGRIGCFLAGCCYGMETDLWFGLPSSFIDEANRVPTQLFESIFLFILSSGLSFAAFKYNFKYTMIVYMGAYSLFRFVIEFFRDDYRGGTLLGMSPSQVVCVIILALIVPTVIIFNKYVFKGSLENEK